MHAKRPDRMTAGRFTLFVTNYESTNPESTA
jgi:hypothetical protein